MSAERMNETPSELAAEPVPLELLVDMDRTGDTSVAAPGDGEPAPRLAYGTVGPGKELTVLLPEGTRKASRAKSCLVAAEEGNRVLCSVDRNKVYVLAVLDGDETTKVITDGKLEIRAGGELSFVADTLKMRAKSALLALEDLRLIGRTVEATLGDKASIFAERIESRASRFLQRAKQAFRFVEELEQVRAGNFDLRAEGLAAVRGENTIIAARVLAKIDGEQVKIG